MMPAVFSTLGWDSFANGFFGSRPCIVRQKLLLATPEDGFRAMVSACDAFRAGRDVPIKLHVNGMRLVEGIHARLPRREDGTLAGYEDRMDQLTRGGEYGIYCASFQEYDQVLYDRARELLENIGAHCELPDGFVELELFVGKYVATAGGIHRESCFNFHQVIDGTKSILVWPRDWWTDAEVARRQQQEPADGNEETFLDDMHVNDWAAEAIELTGWRGDILYWPDGSWHVGVSPEISLSVNAAVYPVKRGDHTTRSAFEKFLGPWDGSSAGFLYPPASEHVRQFAERRIEAARRIVSSAEFGAEIAAGEIRRMTGRGFRAAPPRLPARKEPCGRVRLIDREAMVWVTVPGYIVYGGRGYSEIAPDCAAMVDMLEQLAASQTVDCGSLLSQERDPAAKTCADVIRHLESMGLVDRE
jgi:hypothetical protein